MRAALGSGIGALACAAALVAPAAAAELVAIPSEGPGPAEVDQVYVNKIGPADARRVLVLMPGTSGGAGDFTLVARAIVKRVPNLAVWAIDRRSQALEETEVFEQLEAGEITLQEAFAHYLGWITNSGQPADHYRFLNANEHPYAREWGMETALEDARQVVRAAKQEKAKVWLGGHSLGASLTAAYAAWDFGGKPGFKDVEGLVLIDGGLLGSFDGFDLEQAQDAIEALETGNPFGDLLGLGVPESAGLFAEIGGYFARLDPLGSAAGLQAFPLLPDSFDPGFPVTNRGLFGFAFDRDTSPQSLRLLHANMGGLNAYEEGSGGLTDWTDGGITPVKRMARTFGQEPVNAVEWFFPRRLTIDTNGANAMKQNDVADFLGLRLEHTNAIDVPIYAFQTDLTQGGVLDGAERLVRRAKTKQSDAVLVDGAPQQSHLDPLTASPKRNEFLKTVVKFLDR